MIKAHRAVALLRVFLVLLFGILVLFQTMSLPGEFAHMARQDPEHAYLRWPATAVTVLWVLCIQMVIVCSWKLLAWAIAAAWVVLVGGLLYIGINADDPGLPLLLFLMAIGVTVLGLLMVVMRALLRRATTMRTDMEAVI